MPDTEFYTGSDWQGSSGPIIPRNYILSELWPQGLAQGKDVFEPGMHQAFAIGPNANQPLNIVGVSTTYNTTSGRIEMNIAPGFIFRAYVANVLTYNAGAPNTWAATLNVGDFVYLDHSTDLPAGTTLSRSPLDEDGHGNPRCGIVCRRQTEDPDTGIGGGNAEVFPKSFTDGASTHTLLVDVMLWPDTW